MELIERVEQLEQRLKVLRPDLHFPSTATLEHRLRWLEIVLGEIRARDTHSIYAETPSEENLRELLAKTVYIKQDRITLHSLTADPGSCVGGDTWFRSDLGKSKQAIDAVVANAKLLRREGDTIPAAEIASLDAAKITTGRFGKTRLEWTLNKLLKGAGAGADPTEIDVPAPPTYIHAHLSVEGSSSVGQGTWILNAYYGVYKGNSTSADLDNISYKVWLAAGTYAISLAIIKGTNRGILDVDVDGVEVGSVDCYETVTIVGGKSITGIVIASAGEVTLRFRVHGKNAGSTSYRVDFGSVSIGRAS